MMELLRLDKLLSQRGYCSRREATVLIRERRVLVANEPATDPSQLVDPYQVQLDGEALDPGTGMVVMLNKPAGYVCSQRDREPTVFELLPQRFGCRNPILAIVGRLDKDTTGLLLLSDDGTLVHRLTSPKYHVPKVYLATLAHPLRGDEESVFASGTLRLSGENDPLLPAQLTRCSEKSAELVLYEGRFHQVKRMFAAVGNQVIALHRKAMGPLTLGDLNEGEHRIITEFEATKLRHAVSISSSPGDDQK